MSSYICNDITTEAVGYGFYRADYIEKQDIPAICEALRILNEIETGYRYSETSPHHEVKLTGREFDDVEIIGCAKCLRYQCEEDASIDSDLMTIFEALRSLPEYIESAHVASGDWQAKSYRGERTMYAKTEYPTGDVCYDIPIETPWGID